MIDNHCSNSHVDAPLTALIPSVVFMKVEDEVELMLRVRNDDVFRQKELERAYAILEDLKKKLM